MRRQGGILLAAGLAVVLAAAPESSCQDAGTQAHFWAHRTFYIPVAVEKLPSDPKPTDLQLYYSLNRGPWQKSTKLPVTGLLDLVDQKKGFKFSADRDGEYEFSVQSWYPDGSSSPKRVDELPAMLGVVIDTTPPIVRISSGPTGVRWDADDQNLDPNGVVLQCKFPQWRDWRDIPDRSFKPSDSYAWKMQPGQILEVRVLAKDRAGNQGFSPIVRVPNDAAVGTGFPRAGGGAADWPAGGSGRGDPLTGPRGGGTVPEPRYSYVNGKDITVDYTIQKVGRSGIRKARLYVLSYKDRTSWKPLPEVEVNIQPTDRDQTLSLKYAAPEEGVYGFYVALESGAGVKTDPPRDNDPPMMIVVADTTDPEVKITGVRVSQGVRGPVVEIAWETFDKNLMPDPVSLEYSADRSQWKEIKSRLPAGTLQPDPAGKINRYVGQYAWEVPDENVWKFYIRMRSTDLAGRVGVDEWCGGPGKDKPIEVMIDLEKPAAAVTAVRGGSGGGGSAPSDAPIPGRPPQSQPSSPPESQKSPPAEAPKSLPDVPKSSTIPVPASDPPKSLAPSGGTGGPTGSGGSPALPALPPAPSGSPK